MQYLAVLSAMIKISSRLARYGRNFPFHARTGTGTSMPLVQAHGEWRCDGARVSVCDGTVTIVAKNGSIMEKAQEKIAFLVGREIEVGGIYKGVISSVKEYGAFVEFNGGQQGLLHISELTHEPVSKVSDLLSVGQELSVMCIGQDIRGNIKLSLKATIPKKASLDKQASVPAKQSANVGVSPSENAATCTGSSTPSILIRSAAECEAQDRAAAIQRSKAKSQKPINTPRPYEPSSAPQNLEESGSKKKRQSKKEKDVSDGTKRKAGTRKSVSHSDDGDEKSKEKEKDVSKGTKRKVGTRKSVSHSENGDNKNNQVLSHSENGDDNNNNQALSHSENGDEKSKPSAQARTLKIGDRLPAKVYQIRTLGLVLELHGGIRGMYKFEENGRRDFEVGKELQVRCSSFSTKGVPIFSLAENE